jgi:hypothetical protein
MGQNKLKRNHHNRKKKRLQRWQNLNKKLSCRKLQGLKMNSKTFTIF